MHAHTHAYTHISKHALVYFLSDWWDSKCWTEASPYQKTKHLFLKKLVHCGNAAARSPGCKSSTRSRRRQEEINYSVFNASERLRQVAFQPLPVTSWFHRRPAKWDYPAKTTNLAIWQLIIQSQRENKNESIMKPIQWMLVNLRNKHFWTTEIQA